MHRCKVTSANQRVMIDEQTYQELYDQISVPFFRDRIKMAKESITLHDFKEEKRIYHESFTLPMRRNMFGLLTIPVYINHVLCHFIVDTGAQISGIRSSCIKKVGACPTKGKLDVGSIGGKEQSMAGYRCKEFQIGGIAYVNKAMIVLEQEQFSIGFGSIDLMNFDGILGWDVLSSLDFEMDDIAHEFRVLKNCYKFPTTNIIPGSFPVFLCKNENGKIAVFGFDSGSKVSWLSESYVKEQGISIVASGDALGFGVHGIEKLPMKIVDELTCYLDRAKITLKDTMTGRCHLFENFTFDGVFGNQIFKGRRIRIVNSKNVVLLV